MNVHCNGHQDHLNVIKFYIVIGNRTEAERLLYRIVEAGSDLELSDDERDEAFEPVIQEDGAEEDVEESDTATGTDRDEQERRSLWARSSM